MSDSAIPTQGTKIYIGDVGSPDGFTAIPEVRSISGPNEQRSTRNVTDLDSTAHEKRLNLKDAGDLSLGIFYLPANAVHLVMRAAFNAGTLKRFRIEYEDTAGSYEDFDAYITGWSRSIDVDSDVNAEVQLTITGDITEGS